MGKLVDSLNKELSSLVHEAPKLKAAKKDDLREYIQFLIKSHRSLIAAFGDFSDDERRKITNILDEKEGGDLEGVNAYVDYKSKLRGKAHRDENSKFMASFETAAKAFIDVLDEIDKQLDNLFINDAISILNAKLSHLTVLGALALSRTVHRMSVYILHAVTNDLAGNFDVVPRYRIAFIQDNSQDVANTVTKIYEKDGITKLLLSVSNLKKENLDIQLVSENNTVNTGFIREADIDKGTTRMLHSMVPRLNFVRAIGEFWNNIKHWYMMEIKGSKEFMEAQTRILKLKLDDNPDEAERARLEKIIRNYNDQITEIERKLAEYERK